MPFKPSQRVSHLTAYVDDALHARLVDEQRANGDVAISETIARRLTYAAQRLPIFTTADLDWRPVSRSARPVEVPLDKAVQSALNRHAERLGFAQDVLTTTLLHDDRFTSRSRSDAQGDAPLQLGYLRTERGRGRIYGMYFEMPGYQYAFLRSLGRDSFSGREVLDIAFLALAREVCSRSTVGGIIATPEAVNFAKKILKLDAYTFRSPRTQSSR